MEILLLSNSDAASDFRSVTDVYIVWGNKTGDIKFTAGHGCADAQNGCEFGAILDLSPANAGRFTEARVATSSDGQFEFVDVTQTKVLETTK